MLHREDWEKEKSKLLALIRERKYKAAYQQAESMFYVKTWDEVSNPIYCTGVMDVLDILLVREINHDTPRT